MGSILEPSITLLELPLIPKGVSSLGLVIFKTENIYKMIMIVITSYNLYIHLKVRYYYKPWLLRSNRTELNLKYLIYFEPNLVIYIDFLDFLLLLTLL